MFCPATQTRQCSLMLTKSSKRQTEKVFRGYPHFSRTALRPPHWKLPDSCFCWPVHHGKTKSGSTQVNRVGEIRSGVAKLAEQHKISMGNKKRSTFKTSPHRQTLKKGSLIFKIDLKLPDKKNTHHRLGTLIQLLRRNISAHVYTTKSHLRWMLCTGGSSDTTVRKRW